MKIEESHSSADWQMLVRWLLSRMKSENIDSDNVFSFSEWWDSTALERSSWKSSIDQAIVMGFMADRLAYAFAGGYQAGIQRLVPLPDDRLTSLCITEEGGGHPRAIRTTLRRAESSASNAEAWRLDGNKRWLTMVCEAERLLVAASTGATPDGRNQIRLVVVSSRAPGVQVEPMPALPFVPEISHGTLQLDGVAVPEGDLLPGDGYSTYIKPFRTLEDLHVNAAVLGHLLRLAGMFGWPRATQEELLGFMLQLRTLTEGDPLAPECHILLGGVLASIDRLLGTLDGCWALTPPEIRDRWVRDAPLRQIAGKARARRLEVAWNTLSSPVKEPDSSLGNE